MENARAMTSHELGEKLLAMPDVPVVKYAGGYGPRGISAVLLARVGRNRYLLRGGKKERGNRKVALLVEDWSMDVLEEKPGGVLQLKDQPRG